MKLFQSILGAVLALGLAGPVAAAEKAIIVLDGSGSMWAQVDGTPRISIARDTLAEVLSTLPGDLELGLVSYGHREKGNCADIELMVAPAADTGAAINSAASKINPKGMTPLSDAVRIAAEELAYTEQKATVILITDGLETCEVDPCALGLELADRGIDFTAHVVGFGLSNEEGKQVACLAENTGGRYFSAGDGDALVDALTTTVREVVAVAPEPAPAPEPVVAKPEHNIVPTASLSEDGPDLFDDRADLVWRLRALTADGSRGEMLRTEYNSDAKFSADPGDYVLEAQWGRVVQQQPITVPEDGVVEPHFVLNGVLVKAQAVAWEGQAPHRDAQIRIHYPGGDSETNYGSGTFRLPAGQLRMVVTLGAAVYEENITAAAGETIDKSIVLDAAHVVTSAVYAEGVPVTSNDLAVRIYKAKKAIDGSRTEVSFGYGADESHYLLAGDYVARHSIGDAVAETPFTVAAGEEVAIVTVLDAGVAAFTIPDNDRSVVLSAKAGIDGKRTEFGTSFDASWQTTLNAGDYVMHTRLKDKSEFETPFSITSGERLELTIVPAAAGAAEAPSGKTKTK